MKKEKPLVILLSGSLLFMMIDTVSGARYARLLQSTSHADATSHGGPDASVTIAPPQAPAHIINDDKKESTNPMDDGKIVHCINSCCRLHYRGKCTKCCPPGED